MEITGKVTADGKIDVPENIIADMGLKPGVDVKITLEPISDERIKAGDAQKIIGIGDKFRTKDKPSFSVEQMDSIIADGANRGRFH